MKIVIATPFYPPEKGVLGVYAEGLERAFEKQGHTVKVASLGGVRHLPPLVRHLAYFFRVLIATRGSGLVLLLDTWSVGFPGFVAATLFRVPFAVRVGGDHLWESYVDRTGEPVRLSEFYFHPRTYSLKEHILLQATQWLLGSAAAVFFNTTFQKKIWADAYAFSQAKSKLLENSYPPVIMHEAQGRVFVSANRGRHYKNVEMLERAFARVQSKFPLATLDSRLLPREEHIARLKSAYAVIVPSISEVGSNNVIDGISHGKPFIITDDTGTSERLAKCGLFIDTRSEDALVQAIETILKPDVYEYKLARIREFDFTHSWDDIAREIISAIPRV